MGILKNFGAFVTRKQSLYHIVIIFALSFLSIAFNFNLALIYVVLVLTDKFITEVTPTNPISKSSGSSWVLETLAFAGVFLFVSTLLVSYVSPQSLVSGGLLSGPQSIFQLLSTYTPILKDNVILTFISWVIIVAIVETELFFNKGQTLVENQLRKAGFSGITLIVATSFTIAALFVLFHIQAKGFSTIPLLITFIFAIISTAMVRRHRESKGAVALHMMINGGAVASSLHWI